MTIQNALDPQAARRLETADLIAHCAADTADSVAWAEFLTRMSPSIRAFVRTTLKQEGISPDEHERDLQQNVIVRLVANDCAVLRRFTGSTEDELRVYIAVIARSVVRDFARRQRAAKRPPERFGVVLYENIAGPRHANSDGEQERQVLSRELIELGKKIIQRDSRGVSGRDSLIFILYYVNGFSSAEISRCRGVGLTQRAVVGVINRLTEQVRLAAADSGSAAEEAGR